MQLSQIQSTDAPARAVAGILWLGLGATGAWLLAQPAVTPALGLPLAIGLLTLFVAAIVATFSLRYMRADDRSTRFFVNLSALVASVLAFLFTGNLIVLGIAWCASGWLLAGLIGHSGGWKEADAAARRARLSFFLGDAALLAAIGILGWHAGSLQVDAIIVGGAVSLTATCLQFAELAQIEHSFRRRATATRPVRPSDEACKSDDRRDGVPEKSGCGRRHALMRTFAAISSA